MIPPNSDLNISGGVLKVVARSGPRRMQMPVDEFFELLAADRGAMAIGIILSGTGSDGSAGIRAIKEAGGITFAQSMETAEHRGMPGNAIATGSVDYILSPELVEMDDLRIGEACTLILSPSASQGSLVHGPSTHRERLPIRLNASSMGSSMPELRALR